MLLTAHLFTLRVLLKTQQKGGSRLLLWYYLEMRDSTECWIIVTLKSPINIKVIALTILYTVFIIRHATFSSNDLNS